MPHTVLVTEQVFGKAADVFRNEQRLRAVACEAAEVVLANAAIERGARAVIVGIEPYVGPLYEALARVGGAQGGLIARFGVGHDSIDKDAARRHGIVVTNTPGVLETSVAEHTMWLIGSLARHVAACHASLRAGDWAPRMGRELRGSTLGIVGLGAIGRQVARIAHFGFQMRVIAADCLSGEELQQRSGLSLDQIQQQFGVDELTCDTDRVFREADILSIHLPATSATGRFVSAERLRQMKRDALLINTARGAVVDEEALYDALADGRLGGAALDVYQVEPYRPVSPARDLRTLENVVLTPHTGSNTRQANRAMARAALDNAVHFLQGDLERLSRVM
jgi:lactate dehydrogenase-like 2-hydroxyacid dehydrogenase